MEPDRGSVARGRLYLPLGVGAGVAGILTYIWAADPHRPGFLFPGCPFKLLTGWDCPACGGLRMTHDLLHADLGAAVTDNVFALIGLPLLAAWILVRWRSHQKVFPIPAMVTVVAVVVIWTVVRNLPGFPLVPTFTP